MATLLLFARAREAAGVSSMTIQASTAADVVSAALESLPGLHSVIDSCAVMVDGTLARSPADVPVADDSEVALLPPVSGG